MKNNRILILGYSSIAKRKVIPAIKKIGNLEFEICSKSSNRKNCGEKKWHKDYDSALKSSKSNIAYISLPNSMHYKWAKRALTLGYHVIIDKPATIKFSETLNLIKLAKIKKRLLAEAIVYNYHNQITSAIKYIGGYRSIKKVYANFKIPMPKKNNIRKIKKLKSYCFYDMNPYAASIPRIFYKKNPKKIYILNKKDYFNNFSLLMKFSNGIFVGDFAYGPEYNNTLTLFSKNKIIQLNKIFSPPNNINTILYLNFKNKLKKIKLKKDDSFFNFLKIVLKKIKNKDYEEFLKIMRFDSEIKRKF